MGELGQGKHASRGADLPLGNSKVHANNNNDNNNTLDLYSTFLVTQRHLTKNSKNKNKDNKYKEEIARIVMVVGSFEEVSFEGFLEDGWGFSDGFGE